LQDNDSHFHESLDHWRQLNQSTAFLNFANKADGLSAFMLLLIHNWMEVVDLWIGAVGDDYEALGPLFECVSSIYFLLGMY
jgi:U3 small nucleolar RNA-associated protein 20